MQRKLDLYYTPKILKSKAHIPVYHEKIVPAVFNLSYVAKQWTKSMKELIIINDAKTALQGTEVSWGKPL